MHETVDRRGEGGEEEQDIGHEPFSARSDLKATFDGKMTLFGDVKSQAVHSMENGAGH